MSRMNMFLTLATVVATCLVVSTASAQQRGRGGFGFGPYNAVTIAANDAVQKELGLSGDISGKLAVLRDDYRAAAQKEYQNAGIDFQNLSAEDRQKIAEIGGKLTASASRLTAARAAARSIAIVPPAKYSGFR